ncbi:MAG: peptidoglycan editing factor PgeF [Nitrosomonadales bacterium]|nr:peptidoglycan editing factor PgeF [Nitrosomonadales bacterium]
MNLLERFIIPCWPAPPNVKALQTTRNGGVSAAPYASLNLGDHVGDVPLAVARNRRLLEPLLPSEPVWLKQEHGTVVVDAAATVCGPQADACISSRAGAVCVVMTADCLPLLLCDERGSVAGAVHAGWRGLCDGVIEQTVRAMNVRPEALMAWLGPAIGARAFEVGGEVRAAFIARQPEADAAFVPSLRPGARESIRAGNWPPQSLPQSGADGKWLADIYRLARLRLNALGVDRIYGGDLCTYTDRDRFFSYRRDGVTGRMGTFIWLE